jgi:hypothetical protein
LLEDEQVSGLPEKLSMLAMSASLLGNVLASLDRIRMCLDPSARVDAG